MKTADYVIIGSGQGGVPLAIKLAQQGREVFVFERSAWGGTCVNTGCIPSKTLLASAHAAAAARQARHLGVECQVSVRFGEIMNRVRDFIQPAGIADTLKEAGVHMVNEEAEFVAPHKVLGGETMVEAETIVINTGKSPFIADIPGLEDTPYLTYQNIWQMNALPERMAVIGGGYTGIELAQALQRLGSQVFVIEIGERVVGDEEPAVSQALRHALESDGTQFYFETDVREVKHQHGVFTLRLDSDDEELVTDSLLVATGRRPNIAALDVTKWGIDLDSQGHIKVDDQFRTTADGVYAIGDVTGQPAFTHVSWEDHRRLLAILDGNGQVRRRGDRVLGYAFFTEPQVGRAGLTLAQAQASGYDARAATLGLPEVHRATMTEHTGGFYRLVIDNETDRILGGTLVGPQAAELIHIIMAHMEAGATWKVLEQSQYIHPAYAEDLPTLARELK